jgi:hypothetical protein
MQTRYARSSLGFTAEMAPMACTLFSPMNLTSPSMKDATKAIHFAASAAANFEIMIQTDFQTDSLLPGELELSYY